MQRLIIDIGNSLVKLAVYNNDQTIMTEEIKEPDTGYIQKIISDYPQIKSSILSAVKDYPVEIDDLLNENFFHVTLNSNTPLPFINRYATPETLGKDRIAAAAAAVKLFPDKNVLVIDAGTSITYEMVTETGVYLGGGISPGIQMRFKALNTFTGKLPLITAIDNAELIGDNTQNSIRSGVLNGVVAEVEGIISRYNKRFEDLRIIISGGDYNYFDKKLKNSIFATPNIVMQGLMEILKFNEDQ
jgi:type III pantothenate kinase